MQIGRFIHSGICLALFAFAAGCGSAPAADNAPASPPSATQPAPQTAAQPQQITVKHSHGEAVIPAEPKRIAVTQQIVIDWLLPLGLYAFVSPKATPTSDFAPYLPAEQRNKLTLIGPPGNPNLEAILAQSPDVIFINNNHEKAYDQLSKIAPSIFMPSKDNWRELLREYGTMLHREKQAEAWLQGYQQKADKAKAQLTASVQDKTVAFVRFLPKELRIYSNPPATSVGGVLYTDLGLKPPAGLATDSMYQAVSLEGMLQMNPDYIFMQIGFIPESDEEARKRYEEITEGSLWKQISAVKNNHLYPVDDNFFNNSPLGKTYVIDTVTATLAK